LPPAEYEALRESIRQHGVGVPSIWDEAGHLIDGANRERACKELGIACPQEIREFKSEAEKLQLTISLNVNRRHLTRTQKRELIAAYLKIDPEINDRHLGDIMKVSKNTVAAKRREMESTGQIDQLEHRMGRDGKLRPARHRRIIANTLKEAERAMEAIKHLPASCLGKILDATTAARRAKKQITRERLTGEVIEPTKDDEIRLYHCGFQDLEKVAEISPASAAAIVTDIPYGADFLPQFPDLVKFAARVLVEGGLFVTLSGKMYLDKVMAELGKHLQYGWIHASVWQGEGNVIYPRQVISRWKPVVIYTKGKWRKIGRWTDVTMVPKEKDWHDWQQPLAEVELLVRYFTQPGQLVIDPCGGAFTTALACKRLGRRFIGCDVEKECILKGQARLKEDSRHDHDGDRKSD
jgi:site-specific DNA-methyltransferase (adenine-specific)